MIDYIKSTLLEEYSLQSAKIEATQGGWSAAAFVAHTDRGDYFIKLYDKRRSSVQFWIDRMASYMPVVLWLSENTRLKDNMIVPIFSKAGDYKIETEGYVLLAFPFIEGEALAETRLSAAQIRRLADILALLHSYGEELPLPTDALKERYAPPFIGRLESLLQESHLPDDLEETFNLYGDVIWDKIKKLRALAEQLRGDPPPMFCCHTDLHGWNLMGNGRLILIDWEGLSLAPVEADLFSFTEGFFFDYAREPFLAAYKKARPGYSVNEASMSFYRRRRRLEDITDFADSLTRDNLSAMEAAQSLAALRKECEALLQT